MEMGGECDLGGLAPRQVPGEQGEGSWGVLLPPERDPRL